MYYKSYLFCSVKFCLIITDTHISITCRQWFSGTFNGRVSTTPTTRSTTTAATQSSITAPTAATQILFLSFLPNIITITILVLWHAKIRWRCSTKNTIWNVQPNTFNGWSSTTATTTSNCNTKCCSWCTATRNVWNFKFSKKSQPISNKNKNMYQSLEYLVLAAVLNKCSCCIL